MSRAKINPCTPWVFVPERGEFFRLNWGALEVAPMRAGGSLDRDSAQAVDPTTLGDDDVAFDLVLLERLAALTFYHKGYTLDGHPADIFRTAEDARLSAEDVGRIAALCIGDSLTIGEGGQTLKRVALAHGAPVKVGDRVVLARDVDRFPHFIARAGSTGVITNLEDAVLTVRLDEYLEGAEEWDNEVCWETSEQAEDFDEDVKLAA
ncbi:MAG: hypothetical protein ACJ74Q_15075 [Pyrinomonadaceae bacterium]